MKFQEFRESEKEQERIRNILGLVSGTGGTVLDIGARDGYFSAALTDYFSKVIALDLKKPEINNVQVECVKGDVTELQFSDNSFDLVFCAEVLEHIPSKYLEKACAELARVTGKDLIVGVPYKQDIRVGRLLCQNCGQVNPPWGHVNIFDEDKLKTLFNTLSIKKIEYVGQHNEVTNWFSTQLMDWAGNPYGSYGQEENCIFCESKILAPVVERSLIQKGMTKMAFSIVGIQKYFTHSSHNWVHILFEKQ